MHKAVRKVESKQMRQHEKHGQVTVMGMIKTMFHEFISWEAIRVRDRSTCDATIYRRCVC